MTATVIFSGGDQAPIDLAARLPTDRFVIAADAGVHSAQALAVTVDVLIGDMDSATPEAVAAAREAGARVDHHSPHKDATDLELAMDLACERGEPVIVVGGAGFDRIDHLLAVAPLLCAARYAALSIQWWVKGAVGHVVHDLLELSGAAGDLISLIPIGGDVGGVSVAGVKWPLNGEDLASGTTRGVSNLFLGGRVTVTLESGTLLVVHDERAS